MLSKSVTYTDYADQQRTETLYFNLTRTEIYDNMDEFESRLRSWQEKTAGEERDLTTDEVRELLEIVRYLMKHAYGIRTDDGRTFKKSPELWEEFTQTAVYDEFVMQLFSDTTGQTVVDFMTAIMPQQVRDEMAKGTPETNTVRVAQLPPTELKHVDDEVPAWIRENREPTKSELQRMSPEELREAYMRKSQGGSQE